LVSTYLFFKSYNEGQDKIKSLTADNDGKTKAASQANADLDQIKSMIGAAATDKIETVGESTKKDLEKYGKNIPAADQNYRYLAKSLATERDAANKQVAELTAEKTALTEKIKTDESAHTAAIAEYTQKLTDATNDLKAEREKF